MNQSLEAFAEGIEKAHSLLLDWPAALRDKWSLAMYQQTQF